MISHHGKAVHILLYQDSKGQDLNSSEKNVNSTDGRALLMSVILAWGLIISVDFFAL